MNGYIIYHIYNRGVEKRKTFLDKQDYLRFIHCLFEFNDENPTLNTTYYFNPIDHSLNNKLEKVLSKATKLDNLNFSKWEVRSNHKR